MIPPVYHVENAKVMYAQHPNAVLMQTVKTMSIALQNKSVNLVVTKMMIVWTVLHVITINALSQSAVKIMIVLL
jgi:hypothetical protein